MHTHTCIYIYIYSQRTSLFQMLKGSSLGSSFCLSSYLRVCSVEKGGKREKERERKRESVRVRERARERKRERENERKRMTKKDKRGMEKTREQGWFRRSSFYLSLFWIGRVTDVRSSCHIDKWVMTLTWMSHVMHIKEACTWPNWIESHHKHASQACITSMHHKHACVVSHRSVGVSCILKSHFTNEAFLSPYLYVHMCACVYWVSRCQ